MAITKVSVQQYLGTHYRPDVEYIEGELQERNVGEIEHAEMMLAVLGWFLSHKQEWPMRILPDVRVQVRPDRFRVPDICLGAASSSDTRIVTGPPLVAQSSDLCRTTVVLAYIGLLYQVEREARDDKLNAGERFALRQAKSCPILDDLKAYLEAEQLTVLPKSPLGEAINYTISNWRALERYCDDGDLEIDNNGAERSLRPIVVGRNNWMFYGSHQGGRTGAVLSTLIASCKRLRVEPFTYLRDLFTRISSHPHNRLDELLPDRWQAVPSVIQG